MLGYTICGLWSRYFQEPSNKIDIIRLIFSGVFYWSIMLSQGRVLETNIFRAWLTTIILWMWLRMGYLMQALPHIGLMIIPINIALCDISAFSTSLLMFFGAFFHAFCPFSAVLVAWRVMVFGDHPGAEMVWTDLRETDAVTGNRIFADLVFMVVTFMMSVTMLNIFIAILGMSYEQAYRNAWKTFMKKRCCISSDCMAKARFFRHIRRLLFLRSGGDPGAEADVDPGVSTPTYRETQNEPRLSELQRGTTSFKRIAGDTGTPEPAPSSANIRGAGMKSSSIWS